MIRNTSHLKKIVDPSVRDRDEDQYQQETEKEAEELEDPLYVEPGISTMDPDEAETAIEPPRLQRSRPQRNIKKPRYFDDCELDY